MLLPNKSKLCFHVTKFNIEKYCFKLARDIKDPQPHSLNIYARIHAVTYKTKYIIIVA